MTSNSKGGDKKVPLIPLKRGIPHPRIFFENHKTHSYIASAPRKKLCRGRLLRNVKTTRH